MNIFLTKFSNKIYIMAITREEIKGTKIINEVKSSNIRKTEYDTETKKMLVKIPTSESIEPVYPTKKSL